MDGYVSGAFWILQLLATIFIVLVIIAFGKRKIYLFNFPLGWLVAFKFIFLRFSLVKELMDDLMKTDKPKKKES